METEKHKGYFYYLKSRTTKHKSKAEVEAGQSLATYPEALLCPAWSRSTLINGISTLRRTMLRLWFHLLLDRNIGKLQPINRPESNTTN